VLLVVSACIEPQSASSSRPPNGAVKTCILGALLLLYIFTWVPLFYGISRITDTSRSGPEQTPTKQTATAPAAILWSFSAVMFVVFSLFAVVYVADWINAAPYRENYYITLSMIAKTILHLIVGLTVIGQAATLSNDSDAEMDTLRSGLIGAFVLAAACAALNYSAFLPVSPAPSADEYNLRASLL